MNSKNRSYYIVAVIIATLCNCVLLNAQTYVSGTTYVDATGYVEYRAGNLPIIISAPHGGDLEPSNIPDRNCSGCVTVKDSWTKPITENIYNSMVAETGCYPHVIINLLHRKKFDANRDVGDAANGNPTVIQSWNNYHAFIDTAKSQVIQEYGSGTFYDMHGHGHTIQRIELGYLLTRTQLQQTDNYLNTNSSTQATSIRTLVNGNLQNLTQAQLVRSSNSFGDLLVNQSFPTVPSSSDTSPQGTEPYFSGGYNTARHGSSDNISAINAIQIELNQDLRFSSANRTAIADSLAVSFLNYHTIHYNNQFTNQYCAVLSNNDIEPKTNIQIYPNPSSDRINIKTTVSLKSYVIYDTLGKVVLNNTLTNKFIDISTLNSGLYFLTLLTENGHKESLRFVKVAP